jgi:hypothetical protein
LGFVNLYIEPIVNEIVSVVDSARREARMPLQFAEVVKFMRRVEFHVAQAYGTDGPSGEVLTDAVRTSIFLECVDTLLHLSPKLWQNGALLAKVAEAARVAAEYVACLLSKIP